MDVSFCMGEKEDGLICHKRDNCQRYLWQLNENNWSVMQSFMEPAPFIQKPSGVSCDEFWSVNNDKE